MTVLLDLALLIEHVKPDSDEYAAASAILTRYRESGLRVLKSDATPLAKVELIGQLREDALRGIAALVDPFEDLPDTVLDQRENRI